MQGVGAIRVVAGVVVAVVDGPRHVGVVHLPSVPRLAVVGVAAVVVVAVVAVAVVGIAAVVDHNKKERNLK